jgi:hypothetical protein
MATQGLQERELAFLSPAGHGLGRYLQDGRHLGGMEVAGRVGCGCTAGLGCHGASLSCGGPAGDPGPNQSRCWSGHYTAGRGHAGGGHPARRRTNKKIMQTDPTARHSPVGSFQRVCYLVLWLATAGGAAARGTRPPALHPDRRRVRQRATRGHRRPVRGRGASSRALGARLAPQTRLFGKLAGAPGGPPGLPHPDRATWAGSPAASWPTAARPNAPLPWRSSSSCHAPKHPRKTGSAGTAKRPRWRCWRSRC